MRGQSKRVTAIILVVFLSFSGIAAFAALTDDFDSYTPDTSLGSKGWSTVVGPNNDTSSAFKIMKEEGNQFLTVSGPAALDGKETYAYLECMHDFSAKSILQFRYRDDGRDGVKSFGVRSTDGPMFYYFLVNNGKMYTGVKDIFAPASSGTLLGEVDPSIWYSVTVILDADAGVYDQYLNGVRVVQAQPFPDNIKPAGLKASIQVRNTLYPQVQDASFSMDDFSVKNLDAALLPVSKLRFLDADGVPLKELTSGEVKADIALLNFGKIDQPVMLAVLAYQDGKLIDCAFAGSEILAGETVQLSAGLRLADTNSIELVAFVWDSLQDMNALTGGIKLEG